MAGGEEIQLEWCDAGRGGDQIEGRHSATSGAWALMGLDRIPHEHFPRLDSRTRL